MLKKDTLINIDKEIEYQEARPYDRKEYTEMVDLFHEKKESNSDDDMQEIYEQALNTAAFSIRIMDLVDEHRKKALTK